MTEKKKISQKDLEDWKDYIKNPRDIVDKDLGKNRTKKNRNRFKFDLHGYTLIDANEKVKELILFCKKEEYKEILLITGKGIHSNSSHDVYVSNDLSKLRFSVPEYIKSNPEVSSYVASIATAKKFEGGDGAIIIKLK